VLMLNKWKSYLLENFKKLNKIEDYGALYERFISNFPELRKEFGVFYTPEYIVEYIVKQTVGELIEGKTPQEISKIKILDPSCGSGSFLLGAYQYLLDYHLKFYHQNIAKVSNWSVYFAGKINFTFPACFMNFKINRPVLNFGKVTV